MNLDIECSCKGAPITISAFLSSFRISECSLWKKSENADNLQKKNIKQNWEEPS